MIYSNLLPEQWISCTEENWLLDHKAVEAQIIFINSEDLDFEELTA